MAKSSEIIPIIAQILAYILAIILIVQILKAIFGGTWAIEDVILALVIFNLTITFAVGVYLISLNNRIGSVNIKISKHIEWHKGLNNGKKK